MTYETTNERMAFNELYSRWTEFMKYTNHKAKTICPELLREYCNFLSNVALRFGSVTAIYNCPEVPSEPLGQYVRDYEKALVEWTGYLADFERREASFLQAKAQTESEVFPVSNVAEENVNTSDPQKIIGDAIAKATDERGAANGGMVVGETRRPAPVADRNPVKSSNKGKK